MDNNCGAFLLDKIANRETLKISESARKLAREATPELCLNLLEKKKIHKNMAAGGFCVSDCSSPPRPSCYWSRLLHRNRQHFYLGGVC